MGNEKTPRQASTAVGDLGQWPKGWTGNFGERRKTDYLS